MLKAVFLRNISIWQQIEKKNRNASISIVIFQKVIQTIIQRDAINIKKKIHKCILIPVKSIDYKDQ